ncbi:MAG TPA: hypothetical protein VK932_20085, partial [Kofleriaceae bacterium]|nr:hypothetical protein [Kofleriaceae bacterium]
MRIALAPALALVAAAAGCGKRAAGDDLAGLDLAEASLRVRALVRDCAGLGDALDRLSRSRFSGRALA